jgi:hypothetical protein
MMFSSCFYSLLCRWLVSSLLYKNRIAVCLCCGGWFDVYGMMVSVRVGFPWIDSFMLSWVLCMVV